LAAGSFAYVLKEQEKGSEPIHYICQACYQNRRKSILQLKASNIASQHLRMPSMYVLSSMQIRNYCWPKTMNLQMNTMVSTPSAPAFHPQSRALAHAF
jgi:hypothetical protein